MCRDGAEARAAGETHGVSHDAHPEEQTGTLCRYVSWHARYICAERAGLTEDHRTALTIVFLLEEGLGYGLVVPFHVCWFALWFRIMKT